MGRCPAPALGGGGGGFGKVWIAAGDVDLPGTASCRDVNECDAGGALSGPTSLWRVAGHRACKNLHFGGLDAFGSVRHGTDEPTLVHAELDRILEIQAPPEVHHVARLRRAIPQYLPGHGDRVRAIEAAATRWPNLVLIGNAYRGVSLSDTVADAIRGVARFLPEPPP